MDHFLHPWLGNPLTVEFLHDGNNGKLSNILRKLQSVYQMQLIQGTTEG